MNMHDYKLQMALGLAPAWPAGPSVQPFTWPYGPRELIAERQRVREILLLRAKVEKPAGYWNCNLTKTGYELSFQETFVQDDHARVTLMKQIESSRDWRSEIVKERLDTFPVLPVSPNPTTAFPTGRHPGSYVCLQMKAEAEHAQASAEWCVSINATYGWTLGFLQQTSDNLLGMQALCSELKPETLGLVRRCDTPEELDRSMLMMQGSEAVEPEEQ